MKKKKKILILLTAAKELKLQKNKSVPSGYFLGELTLPLEVVLAGGYDYDVATPNGLIPTIDANGQRLFYWSFDGKARQRGLDLVQNDQQFSKPLRLEDLKESDFERYAGLFIPGGHGVTVDLVGHPQVAAALKHFHMNQKPTALICHATAALLSQPENEPWMYQNYQMSVVSNFEEFLAENVFLCGKVCFEYPAKALEKRGGKVKTSNFIFPSTVVRDRELVTGQNPFAGVELGKVFLESLNESN